MARRAVKMVAASVLVAAACDDPAVVSSRKLQAPKVTPPTLVALEPGDPQVIASGKDVDGLHIEGADLSDLTLDTVTFRESAFVSATMRGTRLNGCRFLDVRFERLDALDVVAPDSMWRDCEIVSSRLGAMSVYGAKVNSLRLTQCKVRYLNLRGTSVADMIAEDCAIEELDLTGSDLTRVHLPGCSVASLTLREAQLQHTDLRDTQLDSVTSVANLAGATITHLQLMELAPTLARELGISVV